MVSLKLDVIARIPRIAYRSKNSSFIQVKIVRGNLYALLGIISVRMLNRSEKKEKRSCRRQKMPQAIVTEPPAAHLSLSKSLRKSNIEKPFSAHSIKVFEVVYITL